VTELSDAALETDTSRDAADLGPELSRSAWAESARPVLIETAGTYRAVLTYKELAAEVQERSGIRTAQPIHHWIGDVLGRVARDSASRDEPLLSSLCVNAQGEVGSSYAAAILELTGEAPADPDDHGARQRLACYRRFDAAGLPADGGSSALVPRLAEARSRALRAAKAAREVATCPTCHMALLPTGVCDTCD
jgi:hypothetical protein